MPSEHLWHACPEGPGKVLAGQCQWQNPWVQVGMLRHVGPIGRLARAWGRAPRSDTETLNSGETISTMRGPVSMLCVIIITSDQVAFGVEKYGICYTRNKASTS